MSELLGIHEVYRDGRSVGSLKVTQNGLMTHFECECDYKSDSVLRLAGISGSEYIRLGVLVPEAGKLTLEKSFSKNALAALELEANAGFFAVLSDEQYENARTQPSGTAAAERESDESFDENKEVEKHVTEKAPDEGREVTEDKQREKQAIKNPPEKLPQIKNSNIPEPVLHTEAPDMVIKNGEENMRMQIPSEERKPMLPSGAGEGIPEPAPRWEWKPIPDPSVLFDDSDIANACKDAKGALTMEKDDITLLAIPVIPGEPFPMMPIFCFGDSMMLDGREYIIFKSKNGNFVV